MAIPTRSDIALLDGGILPLKSPVRVASATNVTVASPGATIDGVTMASGDRVLLGGQTAGAENGLYAWNGSAVAMTRTVDANLAAHWYRGWQVNVLDGSTYAGSQWMHTTTGAVTLGSTVLSFTRVGGDTWATVAEASATPVAGNVAGTYPLLRNGGAPTAAGSAQPTALNAFALDSAQQSARVAPTVRIVAWVLNGGTAPAANFTFHLYSFTTAALALTLTAAVGEQTVTITTPTANTMTKGYGAAFSMPAAAGQGFILAVVTSATIATSAAPQCGARLEVKLP